MASGARHDLSVYTLADLPTRSRHVLLTPAARWRVVVEQVKEVEKDVILDAVLRLRAAGETSPTRVSDLLQLPEDLIRHLFAQAAAGGLRVAADGQIQTNVSKVAWVYRDIATGELWPDPAPEVPPLNVRYTAPCRGRHDRGTAGRPITVECLLLDTAESATAEPTSIELARFSRASADRNRRTAVVSSGELCLVASPVVGMTAGYAIVTARGVSHLSLSQHLARASQQYEAVQRWLAGVPRTTVKPNLDLPLRRAVAELRDVAPERVMRREAHEVEAILSRVEFCLRRFVDQLRYLLGIEDEADTNGDAAALVARFALDRETAGLVSRPERGTLGHKVTCLLMSQTDAAESTERTLRDLASLAARWKVLAGTSDSPPSLDLLVERTITLCEQLMNSSEGFDVQQAG
jgi:hypothetical protein